MDYRPLAGLWGAAGFSITGNAMVEVLVVWLVLRLTGSAGDAGLVASAALAASVLALFFGGPLLDRWDRRRLSIGADLLSAVAVAAIPVFDRFGILGLATVTVLVAVGALFDGPGYAAREALRPAASRATGVSLERITAYGEAMDGAGEVAGPAVAGLAVALFGLSTSFWLAGLVFLLGAGTMWALVPTWRNEERSTEPYLAATGAGLRVMWRDRVLRDTAVTLALFGFFITPIVLVLTAEFEPDDRATALGVVIGAFALGGVVGAVAYAGVVDRWPRRPTLLTGFALLSVGLAAMGPALDSLPAVLMIAALTGLVSGPLAPLLSVIVQDRATDEYRGRIISTMGTVWFVAGPLAVAVAGLATDATSPAAVLVMIGFGSLLSTAFAALTPGLRHVERADLRPPATEPP